MKIPLFVVALSEANFTIKGRRLRHTRKPRLAIKPENVANVEVIESEYNPSKDANLKSAKSDANAQIVSKNYLIKTKRKETCEDNEEYFCDGEVCGTWYCYELEGKQHCELVCHMNASGHGTRTCECFSNIGPIQIFTGCNWKTEGSCTLQPRMLFDVAADAAIEEVEEPKPTEEPWFTTEIPDYKTKPTSLSDDNVHESSFLGWSHQLQKDQKKNKGNDRNIQIVENTGGKWIQLPTERPVIESFTFKVDTVAPETKPTRKPKTTAVPKPTVAPTCTFLRGDGSPKKWSCDGQFGNEKVEDGNFCSFPCEINGKSKIFQKKCQCKIKQNGKTKCAWNKKTKPICLRPNFLQRSGSRLSTENLPTLATPQNMVNDAVPILPNYDEEPAPEPMAEPGSKQDTYEKLLEAEKEILQAIASNAGETRPDPVAEPRPEPSGKLEKVRYLEKDGELYFNPFDFFQCLQRWMYDAGMFNRF